MHERPRRLALAIAVWVSCGASVLAVDVPLPGTSLLIRNGRSVRVVVRSVLPIPTRGGATDPTIAPSSILVTGAGGGVLLESLDPAGWRGLGTPPGATGYRYSGDGTPSRPFKVVILKPRLLKLVATDDGSLGAPIAGDVDVTMRLGASPDADTYCARFGGTEIRNTTRAVKRIDSPAPAVCVQDDPCCQFARYHAFTAEDMFGVCGLAYNITGSYTRLLYCGGFDFGGGDSALLFAPRFWDLHFVTEIVGTSCDGNLGPTTAAQTGSHRTCTTAGCRFGVPTAIIADPPEFSVCLTMAVAGPASGSLDCGTGDHGVTIPLDVSVLLTGDAATDPAGTIPGAQPCPVCLDGSCVGGPNAGNACSSTNYDSTTADCPPDPIYTLATLPVSLALTSGSSKWTAVPSGGQARVFAGYCQDLDLSGAFEDPPNACLENGAAVGAGCGSMFESCRQRTLGAFGPNGRNNMTITIAGHPQENILSGPAPGTLAGIFPVPPAYQELVDQFADLPGPGAASLVGTGRLCADAMSCP